MLPRLRPREWECDMAEERCNTPEECPSREQLEFGLTALDCAVVLLKDRGYQDDSSTLNNLSIARGWLAAAARTAESEKREIPEEPSAKVIDEIRCTFPYPHLTEYDARRIYEAVRRGLK